MKRLYIYLCCFLLVILSSCGSRNNKSAVYNPGDRSKFSSQEERELAISQKKAETLGLLAAEQYANAIKLNILVPKVCEDYPLAAAQSLTMNMLQITAANGIAGYGGNPAFVFAALVNPVKEGITNTIPKKNFINYNITFYIANIHSGDVFGTLEQEVMGVGASKEEAVVNAMESVKSNAKLSALLVESSKKIVNWFESHSDSFVSEVQHYLRNGDYAEAYGLLASVPEEAVNCYSFAKQNIDSVHELYLKQMSDSYYRRMQDAIAGSNGSYNPEVAAYLDMIPHNSSVYNNAVAAYESYTANVIANGNAERAHKMFMEEESIALEKLNAEAEIKAQEALMMQMESNASSLEEDASGNFVGEVGNGIKAMLVEKAESIIMGGVSSFLSFI